MLRKNHLLFNISFLLFAALVSGCATTPPAPVKVIYHERVIIRERPAPPLVVQAPQTDVNAQVLDLRTQTYSRPRPVLDNANIAPVYRRRASDNMYKPANVVVAQNYGPQGVIHHHYHHNENSYGDARRERREQQNPIREGAATLNSISTAAMLGMSAIKLGQVFFGGGF